MVHKVNDVKYIVYLPKVLLKFSKKDIIIKERKVKSQIRKMPSQKKHPRENLPKIWSLYESCEFSEGVTEVAKILFSREKAYGRIFMTEFRGAYQ